MASSSMAPSGGDVSMDTEIFDRLFKLNDDDIAWIKEHIDCHIKTCKGFLQQKPPSFREALHEANLASQIAFAENMTDIESKINFYRAHCYRGLGVWDEAYKHYMKSTVDVKDLPQLRLLQKLSKEKMEADPGLEVRRVRPLENLREIYRNKEKGKQKC